MFWPAFTCTSASSCAHFASQCMLFLAADESSTEEWAQADEKKEDEADSEATSSEDSVDEEDTVAVQQEAAAEQQGQPTFGGPSAGCTAVRWQLRPCL